MRLAEPGERFMVVGGPQAGETGTAIDFMPIVVHAALLAFLTATGRRMGSGPVMWCELDASHAPDACSDWASVCDELGVAPPPPGAHAILQRYLMRIEPDQAIRNEGHEDAEQTPRGVEA